MAGEGLDLNVRYYVGSERFFGAGLARFTSEIPIEIPSWSRAPHVVRISSDIVGVETLRVDALGFLRSLEIETLDAMDERELLPLANFTGPYDGWSKILPYGSAGGERIFGSLPVRWEVDGVDVGVGAILALRGLASIGFERWSAEVWVRTKGVSV